MKKRLALILLIIMCLSSLAAFSSCDAIRGFLFGQGTGNNPPTGDDVTEHTHTLEHKQSEQPTCTGEGTAEYWYCAGCGKYFSDAEGNTEIVDLTVSATGHQYVYKNDENKHWKQCRFCGDVKDEESHDAVYSKYSKTHAKTCKICGYVGVEENHVLTEDRCEICGFIADYESKCNSDYGYKALAKENNGDKLQKFYNLMDEAIKKFHNNAKANAISRVSGSSSSNTLAELNFKNCGLSLSEALSVWATYKNDHPLYYWIARNVLHDQTTSLFVVVDDDYAKGSARANKNAELYAQIDGYLDCVAAEKDSYDVALALHDKIIDDVEYALNSSGAPENEEWAHNIVGVFDNKAAVCEGYARSFQLLLNACNIPNALAVGKVNVNEGHAWNLVQIDEAWYWYDLTWDDQPNLPGGVIYSYFCKSGASLDKHVVDTKTFGPDYLYDLPTPATAEYNRNDRLEVDESFEFDGVTYKLCGYNKVSLEQCGKLGEFEIPQAVTHNGKTYSVAVIGEDAFGAGITRLAVPASVEIIYNSSVIGCPLLTGVVFADVKGWTRTPQIGKVVKPIAVSDTELAKVKTAADLLKETYRDGLSTYQYVWEKNR